MLPYTVIKEANPPEVSGTATGVVNFLNFTFSALLGPVFGGILRRVSGGAGAMTLEHYQTAFEPLLYGVGVAVVLVLFCRRRGPGPASAAAAAGDSMSAKTGTGKYERLLVRCKSLEPIPTAVAYPCEASALAGAVGRRVTSGSSSRSSSGPPPVQAIAKKAGIDLGDAQIVDAPDGPAAAAKAVELVRQGKAELLMKGSLHTDGLAAVGGRGDRPAPATVTYPPVTSSGPAPGAKVGIVGPCASARPARLEVTEWPSGSGLRSTATKQRPPSPSG